MDANSHACDRIGAATHEINTFAKVWLFHFPVALGLWLLPVSLLAA